MRVAPRRLTPHKSREALSECGRNRGQAVTGEGRPGSFDQLRTLACEDQINGIGHAKP